MSSGLIVVSPFPLHCQLDQAARGLPEIIWNKSLRTCFYQRSDCIRQAVAPLY